MAKKKQRMKSYKVTGWVCDIAARHELGNIDVQVWPSKASLLKNGHGSEKGCDGAVKLTITFTIPA